MFKLAYNFPFANFASCLTINFQNPSLSLSSSLGGSGRTKNNKNYEKGIEINKNEKIFYAKRSHKSSLTQSFVCAYKFAHLLTLCVWKTQENNLFPFYLNLRFSSVSVKIV